MWPPSGPGLAPIRSPLLAPHLAPHSASSLTGFGGNRADQKEIPTKQLSQRQVNPPGVRAVYITADRLSNRGRYGAKILNIYPIRPPFGPHVTPVWPPSGPHSAPIRPPFGPLLVPIRPPFGPQSAPSTHRIWSESRPSKRSTFNEVSSLRSRCLCT